MLHIYFLCVCRLLFGLNKLNIYIYIYFIYLVWSIEKSFFFFALPLLHLAITK